MTKLSIVLTCHAPYLHWLPETIASIDRQLPPGSEALVVFDSCAATALPAGWRALSGSWGDPNAARNAGIRATEAPWIVFWDADNVMADGYLAAVTQAIATATDDVAIIYSDIQFCDEALRFRQHWSVPQYDYWDLRAENFIDTAAAWRRVALDMSGGWREGEALLCDYACALDITALGWRAHKRAGPPILMRVHEDSRIQTGLRENAIIHWYWRARTLGIVTLLAGREENLARWSRWLAEAELPRYVALYVVENSGNAAFARQAFECCQQLAADRGFMHVDWASIGAPYRAAPGESYFTYQRHQHVAQLYAHALTRVREDLVLTLEDDVVPPLDAARRLGEAIGYRSQGQIGAVAAAYAMPHNPEAEVCAGRGPYGWGASVRWNELARGLEDVACVGGGCTVWANWALRRQPVHLRWEQTLGWDGVVCGGLRQHGYRVLLHGGVRAEHHLRGRRHGVESAERI